MKYLPEKYGHQDEIAGAYVINLLEMPAITERNRAKVHQFYEKLLFTIESLETLGKLSSVQGVAYYVIVKKLEFLRSELVTHLGGDWRSWSFKELLEALRKWTATNAIVKGSDKGNPVKGNIAKRPALSSERAFHSQDRYANNCVYCDSAEHVSSSCNKIPTPAERKAFLAKKKLCFNCACRVCRKRHHTSICEQTSEPSLTTNVIGSSVVHPVIMVNVNGRKFRAILDSGASHSYVSSTLIELINARAVKCGTRRVATLLGVTTTRLLEYDLCLRAVKGDFADVSAAFLALDAVCDYEKLCALDVLGLADAPAGDQLEVYKEFREQLTRNPEEGWYETALPWKGDHPPLHNNKEGSLRRLHNQVSMGKLEEYHEIIQNQLKEGVVEPAPVKPIGREFYMPHRAVIRETAGTTKLRVVYDCSARGEKGAASLNDCLETGPSLQNKIYDVLVRGRFHPVVFAADMRKAFLQVRIREGERDALRFHWLRDLNSTEVIALRFTRALFGLAPSPFLLGGVIDQHLKSCSHRLPQSVAEILRSLYVDDLISGDATITKAKQLKTDAVEIFSDAGFHLHKWRSNAPELEESLQENVKESEDTYAKQNLNTEGSGGGTKLLGLDGTSLKILSPLRFHRRTPSQPRERFWEN